MITKFNFKDRTIKSYAIRKLTPKECFRLMGIRDATIAIMQSTVKSIKKSIKKIFRNPIWNSGPVDFDEEYNRILAETGKAPKIYSDEVEYIRVVALKRKDRNEVLYWEFFREDKWNAELNEQTFDDFWNQYDDDPDAETYFLEDWDEEAEANAIEEDDEEYRRFKIYKTKPGEYIKVEQKVGTEEPVISASQQYKQAGNSIVVDVLKFIYEQLWYPKPRKPKQPSLFDAFFPEDNLPLYPKGYDPADHWTTDGKGNQIPLSFGEGRGGAEKVILTTFSGYDSQLMACAALQESHPDFRWTCAGWSDIDKYACQMHDLVFPEYADKALGDITKIDWHAVRESLGGREVDLFTYSSPCTDISQAGKQMGLQEGSGTRSALLWNVAAAVNVLRPKYLLQENVAALVSEKFMPDFQLWLKRLEDLGYVSKWQRLNAKDYGVAQNRDRVFVISMRKDVAFDYQFPEPIPLEKRLEDVLEEEVDERYFLKDDAVSKFLRANDNDSALFHQFPLPPTHEDAMFLKTWLTQLMEANDGWNISPTSLDALLTQNESLLKSQYHDFQQGKFPNEKFKALFEENMKCNVKG